MNDRKATEIVSNYTANTKYEHLPARAIELTKAAFIDCLGVAVAGSEEPLSRHILEYVKTAGGNEQATVFGCGLRTSAENAALVNGAMAHALDFDDWALCVHGHPSVYLVSSLIALAEKHGYSGKDIITAYVVGFEVVAMLPYYITQSWFDQGWHPTGVSGTLGSCAAACNIMGLDAEKIKFAVGIACAEAAGIRANNGSMSKALHAGNAAMNGIKAAKLAGLGLDSCPNMLEVNLGFIKSFGFNEEADWNEILKDFGREYKLCGPRGLNIKPYPCCGGANFAVEATLMLKADFDFKIDDIESIDLLVNPQAHLALIHHDAKTGLQAKFCMEYVVARTLLHGPLTLADFTDEAVNDGAVRRLMEKCKWVVHYHMPSKEGNADEFDPKGVTLHLKDGRALTRECFAHLGMPSRPMPEEMLEKKFRDCAGMKLPAAKVEKCLELLKNLEKLDNINELVANLF
ncbi:MAG: MmgE/PrpD family protein [Oscillospiraceae bacterium]|nr:MmgE/PrpD family protein [Oscillospiraceae bacterium]